MSGITNVVTLKQYADEHGYDVKRLRRIARNGDWPSDVKPFKFGDIWAIATDAPAIVLPPKSARGTRRPDGRQRHIVFCNATEHAAIVDIVGADNVVDPRVASKQQRDARKLANAATSERADDERVRLAELYGVPMTELPDGTLIVKTENDVDG